MDEIHDPIHCATRRCNNPAINRAREQEIRRNSMNRFPGFWVSLLLLAGMFTISAFAQITPSDDSYILTSSPTANFGAKNILIVQGPGATTLPSLSSISPASLPD
jgi:hypothetical protein